MGPSGSRKSSATKSVGSIDASRFDDAIAEFTPPTSNNGPQYITTGPDGNLWFTETGVGKIGRVTPSGTITEFATCASNSAPFVITTGPDGNLWFTENSVGKIGKITPT